MGRMRPAVGIGGGDSYASMTGKPFPSTKNTMDRSGIGGFGLPQIEPPRMGGGEPYPAELGPGGPGSGPGSRMMPQTGGGEPYPGGGRGMGSMQLGMGRRGMMPQTGGGEPYGWGFETGQSRYQERPMEPGGSGFGRLNNPGYGRSQGYGRSPSPQSRYAPGGQFGDFDMSSIFRGIGNPYGGDPYNYGSGPETDYEMPWEQEGGGGEEEGGGGSGVVDHGTWQQQNGGPDGGQNGMDAWGGGGRGREVGSFGGWAGQMGNMARDLWSGDYSRDGDYATGNQSTPGSQEAAQAQAEATQGPDFQANGGVPRIRRFEGGGGADGADIGDMRGQGRDQAADPSWNDFSGDWGKVIDMATVSPSRGFAEVTGLADKIRDGIGWGGSGNDMGPQGAGAGYGGGRESGEMGAGMNARGGPIRRSMGGIGYAEGGDDRAVRGEGDGRSDEIPALLSNGEHVIPADVVAAMGRGSTDAGHKALNELILKKRAQFRKALGKLPPPKG